MAKNTKNLLITIIAAVGAVYLSLVAIVFIVSSIQYIVHPPIGSALPTPILVGGGLLIGLLSLLVAVFLVGRFVTRKSFKKPIPFKKIYSVNLWITHVIFVLGITEFAVQLIHKRVQWVTLIVVVFLGIIELGQLQFKRSK